MGINATKSKLLAISNKRRDKQSFGAHRQWRPIRLDNKQVRYVHSMDVLGITVQGNGKWQAQSEHILARAHALAHTMGRLVSRTGPPQPITIYTVVKAVLLSTILYGLCLWRPTQGTLARLDSILSWPLRYALCNRAHSVSVLGVLAEFAIPPLAILRAGQLLNFQHRLVSAKSLQTVDHLSRFSALLQRKQYLATPATLVMGRTKPLHPRFVRSIYAEAEEAAAITLQLPLNSALTPEEWTSDVLKPAMSHAAWNTLTKSVTGRKAITLTRVFTSRMSTRVGDTAAYVQPQPQLYLKHELKPHSTERARLRMNIAHTPHRLYTCDHTQSAHCLHCACARADRQHLLMDCIKYAKLRAEVRQQCVQLHIPRSQQDIYLFLGTIPITPALTKDQCLALLRCTGALIHAISEDLPLPHNNLHRYGRPP